MAGEKQEFLVHIYVRSIKLYQCVLVAKCRAEGAT